MKPDGEANEIVEAENVVFLGSVVAGVIGIVSGGVHLSEISLLRTVACETYLVLVETLLAAS